MKLIKILTISFLIIILLSQNIFAIGDILSTADSWETIGKQNVNQTMDSYALKDALDDLYIVFLTIATAVAVIVGAILGIRYMTAGIDNKVDVKESLFPYIISCIIVFGSFGIWKLVVEIMGKI